MTPLERSQLQQLHEGSAAMVRAGDLDAYDDFNRRFHETIYRATHNQFMVEQALALRTRMAAFRRTQLRQGDRMTRSRSEHDDLMRAIARGDGEEAARCMRAHLLNASSALTHYIHSL
jgi:DNA-binding GntR family transcriptional regulator